VLNLVKLTRQALVRHIFLMKEIFENMYHSFLIMKLTYDIKKSALLSF
jgi:hypothetical protein